MKTDAKRVGRGATLLAGVSLACGAALAACAGDDSNAPVGTLDASAAGGDDSSVNPADAASLDAGTIDPRCVGAGTPASTLECTGLYSDFATKTVAAGVRAFEPGTALWADGATKRRWIWLPPGTKIDDSDPNEWTFPVGTRVWKEFSVGGKRVETRMFQKTTATFWVHAAYLWNEGESATTAATAATSGDLASVQVSGKPYHVPTSSECDQCHRGRNDRVLGFEAVGMGEPTATGLTLAQLASEGLLSPPPLGTTTVIGDDGTGAAAAPLAWLHVNCGVACHTPNSNGAAYPTGFRMRIDATQVDGRSASTSPTLLTGVSVPAWTPAWRGQPRIAPGDPAGSLLVQLISTRNDDYQGQMPPLVSHVVDQADVAMVMAWIAKMPHAIVDAGEDAPAEVDAGPDDAGPDEDSGQPDTGPPDTGPPDSGPPDTGPLDAGHDAPSADAGAPDGSDASTHPTDAAIDAPSD